jgi:aspartate racemase
MKKIGFIGGLTWVSTLDYYRLFNEQVQQRTNGAATAEMFMYSVNFGEIRTLTEAGDWNGISTIIKQAARQIESNGASCLLLGANTMHKIATDVQASINIPLIHIAAETAKAVQQQGLTKVALLGTKYTMLADFYREKLAEKNIEVIIPDETAITYMNKALYDEMGKGIFLDTTRAAFIKIIEGLISQGAQGVILGCTEIPILIKQEDVTIPVFDTTAIHVNAAVDFILN